MNSEKEQKIKKITIGSYIIMGIIVLLYFLNTFVFKKLEEYNVQMLVFALLLSILFVRRIWVRRINSK